MAKRKRMKTMKEVSKHFEAFEKVHETKPITKKDFDKAVKKVTKRGSK